MNHSDKDIYCLDLRIYKNPVVHVSLDVFVLVKSVARLIDENATN